MASPRRVRNRTQQANLLPPEIMEIIFEHMGPKGLNPFECDPDAKKALRSCLVVSTYCREFALRHLFRSIQINLRHVSSFPNLDLLLEILCPSSLRVQWMSILPYTRHFRLGVSCHHNKGFDLIEPGLLRLLTVLSEDEAHPLTSFALSIQTCTHVCCNFTKGLQTAVGSFLKMPHLQSLEIDGVGFLSPDFLRGTNICQLDVSSYYPYSHSRDPEMLYPPDEEMRNDLRVRNLATDTSFPLKLQSLETKSLLEGLDHLTININNDNEDTYNRVADILQFTASLKTLTLSYYELYTYSLPLVDWNTNFGEMQALETLEIWIGMNYIDDPEEDSDFIVSAGIGALDLLFAALNTIHRPMPQLAHIRWSYSLGTVGSKDLPFLLFENWLRTFATWRTLDGMLTSDLFPVLSEVQLAFHIRRLNLYRTDDEDDFELLAGLDAEVAARMQRMREEVFPRSVAALGENFELVVTY